MVAATRWLLAIGANPLQALDADAQQQQVFIHQRGREPPISLPTFQGHPVAAVLGEQIQPFIELLLVQQPCFAVDETYGVVTTDHVASPAIYRAHARNWLRICCSVVP